MYRSLCIDFSLSIVILSFCLMCVFVNQCACEHISACMYGSSIFAQALISFTDVRGLCCIITHWRKEERRDNISLLPLNEDE